MVLKGEFDRYVIQYVDDIVIYSVYFEEHLRHIETVLIRLLEYGITLNLKKSQFAAPEIKFSGHRVSKTGIKMTNELVQEIRKWQTQEIRNN